MNEENQELTKQQKAQQAGKDVADTAARTAAAYAGGAAGAKLYDSISKTKLGQNALNKVGDNISKKPLVGNRLAKLQPAIEKAKPAIDSTLGGDDGNLKDANSKTSLNSLVESNGGKGTFSLKKTKIYIGIAVAISVIIIMLFFIVILVDQYIKVVDAFDYVNDMI